MITSQKKESLWQAIYSLSKTYFGLEPWKVFYESDIFGIQSPYNGNNYYISIMGELGESLSLAAYQGEYGLEQFWHLKASEGEMPAGVILSIPHLMVTLDEMRDIDNEQQKYLRKINVKPVRQGMYPNVKQIIPGLLPVTPEPELLTDVVRILEQTIWVIEHAFKNDKVTEKMIIISGFRF